MKSLLAALLCLTLLAWNAGGLVAAATGAPGVEFYGQQGAGPGDDSYWKLVDVEVYGGQIYDYFGAAGKDLYPGSERTVNVRLVNQSEHTAVFYLKTAARTVNGYKDGQGGVEFSNRFDNGEGKSTNLEPFYPGKKAFDAILDNVGIAMAFGGAEFYRGTLGGAPAIAGGEGPYSANWFELGAVPSGNERNIAVTISVPYELQNEYFDTLAGVDWVFAAYEDENIPSLPSLPIQPPPSPPTLAPSPTPTDETATDAPLPVESPTLELSTPGGLVTDVPGVDGKEGITVVVPPANLPKTGGLTSLAAPLGFAVIVILIFLLVVWRREREERLSRISQRRVE